MKYVGHKRMILNIIFMACMMTIIYLIKECSAHAQEFEATCKSHDCKSVGWTVSGPGTVIDVACSRQSCFGSGWTTRGTITATTTCRAPGCFISGWTNTSEAGSDEIYCRDGDCQKFGWTIEKPDGSSRQINCLANDCAHVGQWERWNGRIMQSLCNGGPAGEARNCYIWGWHSK